MVETVIALIFSKAGAILGLGLALAALWLRGSWNKRRAEKAEAQARGLQTQAEIAEGREVVQGETAAKVEEIHGQVEAGDVAGLSNGFNRLRER